MREATLKEVAFEPDAEQLIHTLALLNSNSCGLYRSRQWVRVAGYCDREVPDDIWI